MLGDLVINVKNLMKVKPGRVGGHRRSLRFGRVRTGEEVRENPMNYAHKL